MNRPLRRVMAAVVAVALLVLVATDLWIAEVRNWWNGRSLLGSVVSSLLVLAVTGLIVDEVVARRQRQERSVSVAVQALIVYAQTRRAYDAVAASGTDQTQSGVAADELRALAGMVLTAAPSLFDDPVARHVLEEVERFSVSMMKTLAESSPGAGTFDHLAAQKRHLKEAVQPLLARIPVPDRALLEGSDA